MIDRIEPTRRPRLSPTGFQSWRSLLFMHWPVSVEVLRPLVPAPMELDLHEGVAYVGVVPFAMQGVRPHWWPSSLAFTFLETNVRTYVYHGDKPGVYFFSLEAASWLAVQIAKRCWALPYYHADMKLQQDGDVVSYQLRRRGSPARHHVRYRVGKMLGPSQPGTLEFFLLERYLLFVERQSEIFAGRVHHRPYPAQLAEVLSVEDGLLQAAGIDGCAGAPTLAHYSSGVDVEIFDLHPV